ncbi:MAG: hypothetical protein JXB49_36665 [Bacteroidales bacterium]|nr:hypothetical protein [Bacteroidales bacterium]
MAKIITENKVLIITSLINPNSAQAVRYSNLFKPLLKDCHIVHLTFDSKVFSIDGAENYSVFKGVNKHLLPLQKIIKRSLNNILPNIFFPDVFVIYIKQYIRAIKQISENTCFSIAIVCITPFSFIKLGTEIRILNPKCQIIADLSDPFSANALFTNKNRKIKKALLYEKKHLKYFNRIVVLNEKIKEYYSNIIDFNQISVIEQGINKIFYEYHLEKAQIIQNFKIVYAGGFYKNFRNPEIVFEAINKLKRNIIVEIFGGNKKKWFKRLKYNFINTYANIPQEKLIKVYDNSHLILLVDNSYGIQVPGKTLECFAINRPVLLVYENENSPTLHYLRGTSGVFSCKNNITDITNTIEFIITHYYEIEKVFDYNPYTWDGLSLRYRTILNL